MGNAGTMIQVFASNYEGVLTADDIQARPAVNDLALKRRWHLRRPAKARVASERDRREADSGGTQRCRESLNPGIRGKVLLADHWRVAEVFRMQKPAGESGREH